MERDTLAKKILFGVLDILLVIGAIAAVLTIDRGQWLIKNPAFYQPPVPAEARQYPPLSLDFDSPSIPVTAPEIIPQTGNLCPPEPQPEGELMDPSLDQSGYSEPSGSNSVVADPEETTANTLCEY